MNHFEYRGDELFCEEVPLSAIAAKVGTPTYVYSSATLSRHFQAMDQAFEGLPHTLCYSVKASSSLALLARLRSWGAGFDIVSGGELYRVLRAGADPGGVVFSGVGKTEPEMAQALKAGILLFNVESAEELEALSRVARKLGRTAPFALRVNPDVDPRTHPYVATGLKESKFGIPMADAAELYRRSKQLKGLRAVGIDCHIGSQLTSLDPIREALSKVLGLLRSLRSEGFKLEYLDVGGGLGIPYLDEQPPSPAEYGRAVRELCSGASAHLLLEPGRVLVGNAGVLLARVLYRKQSGGKRFVISDAGMNDLVRPMLYGAFHEVRPVHRREGSAAVVDLVGPVCESTDAIARDRALPELIPGDLLAVMGAGAYGMSMASNYNSRPRPAEVLVDGASFYLIRRRETPRDLVRGESLRGRRFVYNKQARR